MKYDLVDCKITEGENALSVLTDKRQGPRKGGWRVSEGGRVFLAGRSDHLGVLIVTCGTYKAIVKNSSRSARSSFQNTVIHSH